MSGEARVHETRKHVVLIVNGKRVEADVERSSVSGKGHDLDVLLPLYFEGIGNSCGSRSGYFKSGMNGWNAIGSVRIHASYCSLTGWNNDGNRSRPHRLKDKFHRNGQTTPGTGRMTCPQQVTLLFW